MAENKTPLTPAQKRVLDLEIKIKQAKALVQKQTNKLKAAQYGQKRKDDTRRKVLFGSFVLNMLEKNGTPISDFRIGPDSFSDWVKRDDERALFKF